MHILPFSSFKFPADSRIYYRRGEWPLEAREHTAWSPSFFQAGEAQTPRHEDAGGVEKGGVTRTQYCAESVVKP
eukprot:3529946-Rhodomonas_salina.1